jgi:hypothetical protein
VVNFTLREFGFAPRQLNRWASSRDGRFKGENLKTNNLTKWIRVVIPVVIMLLFQMTLPIALQFIYSVFSVPSM